MRGSLHYAVRDETVNSFGRDDEIFLLYGKRAMASEEIKATADPLRG
jgi:hypothetical protein